VFICIGFYQINLYKDLYTNIGTYCLMVVRQPCMLPYFFVNTFGRHIFLQLFGSYVKKPVTLELYRECWYMAYTLCLVPVRLIIESNDFVSPNSCRSLLEIIYPSGRDVKSSWCSNVTGFSKRQKG
jgi:hypothetical protein